MEEINEWAFSIVNMIAQKHHCTAEFNFDDKILNLDGNPDLALMAFNEIEDAFNEE